MEIDELNTWRVAESTVNTYQTKIKELIKNNRNDEAIKLIGYMEELRGMQALFSELMEYVDCFILLDGEPEDKIHPQFTQAKIQLANTHTQIADFFFRITTPLMQKRKGLPKDLVSYLKATDRLYTENRLLKLIGSPLALNFGKA